MSTSVYKPLGLSLSRIPDRMLICRPEIRKVKRVLFEPADHSATQRFVDEELQKITVIQSEKWNFDFKREETLNPNGVYKWRPATPQKNNCPVKARPTAEVDTLDLYADPGEIIRPALVRAVVEEEEMKSPPKAVQNENQKPQRLITDFMTVKKRSISDYSKKLDCALSMERPTKLPRLTDFTS